MERAGVRQDREVDVRGDLDGQRHIERTNKVEAHLAAGGGRGVEPVDLAEPGIAGVMIDVDQEAPLEARDAGPRQFPALHDDARLEVVVGTIRNRDARHTGKTEQRGGRGVLVHDPRLLAERAQRERHRYGGADRVAVWTRVRGDDEPAPGADGVDDLLEPGRALPGALR